MRFLFPFTRCHRQGWKASLTDNDFRKFKRNSISFRYGFHRWILVFSYARIWLPVTSTWSDRKTYLSSLARAVTRLRVFFSPVRVFTWQDESFSVAVSITSWSFYASMLISILFALTSALDQIHNQSPAASSNPNDGFGCEFQCCCCYSILMNARKRNSMKRSELIDLAVD